MEERAEDPFVIVLHGAVDAFEVPRQLHQPAMRALENGHLHLVLDFERVRFIDSTTMSVMLDIRRNLLDRGGQLTLTNVGSQVRRFLRVTGLTSFFQGLDEE